MKRFAYILITILLFCTFTLALTACNEDATPTTNDPVYPEDKTITVCSYNIRLWMLLGNVNDNDDWNLRKPYFEEHLDTINADLYGMQEVMGFQRTEIKAYLTGYTHVGICRETGKENGVGESSSIFFRTERFELLDSGNFWLSETPDERSLADEWGAAATRICSWAKLKDKWTGKSFLYYNTHLDHVSETARVNSADLIMERAILQDLPTIITGDFNANEKSEVYQTVTEYFDDTKSIATVTEDVPTYNAWGDLGRQSVIDFCFVSKGDFVSSSYSVSEKTFPDPKAEVPTEAETYFASDHNAVITKIKMN